MTTTVHVIFNAHLDPIWLWPWTAGLDEALATCRSACDRLDAHPDLFYSRNEAWVYDMVERTDAVLFARIKAHVDSGRWEIVGGWWIQPDCNAPSGFGFERQISLGRDYFQSRFGRFPRTGYNVDSFGHCATLPGFLRAAGQDRYVMMRPQEHEMALPARLFRWRGYEDTPEVTVFRISGAYCHRQLDEATVRRCASELPDGISHTMCFAGVGDHGGGPSEELIAWVQAHQSAFDGLRLEFSTTERFFDAVAADADKLPLVTGELQMHAVGCYTVHRAVKTGVRRAEHLLRQAEIVDPVADLTEAWRKTVFHHFHDTMGGTCLPSAYVQVDAQLGYARAVADEVANLALRRGLCELPDDELQRIVAVNASDVAADSWVEFEPWLDGRGWPEGTALLDERGAPVPHQIMAQEAQSGGLTRLLFKLRGGPGERRVLRMDREAGWQSTASVHTPGTFTGPLLELIEDLSDTWSHGLDRYAETPVATAEWEAPESVDAGPLMHSLVRHGRIGESRLTAEWRWYAGELFAECRLKVHWLEARRLLKLNLPLEQGAASRLDGIPGGSLVRANDGKERPLRDWTLVGNVGVVCPDVFALDGTPERLRLTLLRSALMAHHDPHPGTAPRAVVSDQGVHEFRFRFYLDATAERLEHDAMAWQRPWLVADLTRGMPPRA